MGNNIPGQTKFEYFLKTGQLISFIFYDLKGYQKFPLLPSQDIVNTNFQTCLKQIKFEPQMLKLVLGLNTKYKHRFVVTHNNIVNQKIKKEKSFQNKILPVKPNGIYYFELNSRLQRIQKCKSILKTFLNELDKYLTQNQVYKQFMKENGYTRLALLLECQQIKNKQQNNFSNQIDILKLLNKLSKSKNSKIYYMASMQTLDNYIIILLSNFHPIQVSVSIPVMNLLQLRLWKSHSSQFFTKLQQFQKQKNNTWILQPFIETIEQSNNLYLIYHIIKLINSFIDSSTGQQNKIINQEFKKNNVNSVIYKIGQKIQEGKYNISHLSFDYLHKVMKEYKQKINKQQYYGTTIKTLLNNIYRHNKITQQSMMKKTMIINDLIFQKQLNFQKQQQIIQQNPYFLNSEQTRFQKLIQSSLKQIKRYFILQQIFQNQQYIVENKQQKQLNQQFKQLKVITQQLNTQEILIETLKLCQQYGYTQWTDLHKYTNSIKNYCQRNKSEEIEKNKQQYQILKQQLEGTNKTMKNLLKLNIQLKHQYHIINKQVEQLKQKQEKLINKQSIRTTETIDTHSQPSISNIKQTDCQSLLVIQNKPTSQNILLPPPSPIIPPLFILPSLTLPPPPPFIPKFQSIQNSSNIPIPPNLLNSTQIKINQQKIKPKYQPSKQMKPCLVTNIPFQKISNTIWSQIDDTKVNIDKNLLQSLFFKPDVLRKQNKQEVVEFKKQKIRLIQKQRSKNIEIILTKLRADYKTLCYTLKSGSGKYSNPQLLNSLYKIIPTSEQQSMIRSFSGDIQQLAKPEQFFIQIIKIPEYKSRIKTLIFRSNYQQILDQIQYKQNVLARAFKKATQNSRLHTILQTALALSNYLNGQTNRGGSWGFKIDSIQSFQQVKSRNGKDTLAFVLIKQIWKKYQYPIFQQQQVQQFKLTLSISVNQLSNQIRQLKQNLQFTKKAFSSQMPQDQTDSIGLISSEIINNIQQKIQQLDNLHDITYKNYVECAKFYCQNTNQSSEVFGKKLISCILFVCRTQQNIHKQNQLIKKQQQRYVKEQFQQGHKSKQQSHKNKKYDSSKVEVQFEKQNNKILKQLKSDYSNFMTK